MVAWGRRAGAAAITRCCGNIIRDYIVDHCAYADHDGKHMITHLGSSADVNLSIAPQRASFLVPVSFDNVDRGYDMMASTNPIGKM
jgi:hypothetical protein